MQLKKILEKIGPGPLVTAAFIGPGTVTVCTLAGIDYDFTLLWALALSILATVYLQEISGRIGLITQQDLSELIRNQTPRKVIKLLSVILILAAIGLGNAAYQGGNISGANLGLGVFWEAPVWDIGQLSIQSGSLLFGILASLLLWSGNFNRIEKVLVGLVLTMSLAFIVSAILTKPDLGKLAIGFVPSFDPGKFPTVVALIGTTVVPYNLFLYASLVKKKWRNPSSLPSMRTDISVSVILGGLVSMGILVVGVANPSTQLENAQDIAKGLSGVFGDLGSFLMGFGLMAAGMTSAITAPLAGGLVICGVLGWSQEIKSKSMRGSMGIILILGIVFSSFGIRPVTLITLAQLANGILLPVISGWLIWAGSQADFLGKYKNSSLATSIGILIWLITFILGMKSVGTVMGWF
ncbi:NRAMP (natural resistance-associated macrophage protein)-like metal ion transporter [Algoriphagus boseongensis]|uniref:NRAMP (Natural resistance-associated macrophage protein)-like metal ion transporter n=1 Tax=Algoriphagus boseongensis TaxID=1442587 RepID=A0A4V3D2K0_9BACT|nr:divalent metal cation transporter [Algoriphagus boseongensis]TDQ19197.1 NRAMP (natural resistance-associated macrophage protein)-like metal ion transporter [Algoriphagus boseongensis]